MEEGSPSFNADGLALIQRRIEALNLRPSNPSYDLFPSSSSAENNFSYFSSDFLFNIHGESSNGSHDHPYSTSYIHVAPCYDMALYVEGLRYMARNMAARTRKSRILALMMCEDGSERLVKHLRMHEGSIFTIVQAGDVLVQAAKDKYGAESVNTLIDIVKRSDVLCRYVTSALEVEAFALMKHSHGSKVVLHCLGNLEREQNKFLFDAAAENSFKLAKNEVGMVCLYECILKAGYPYRQMILNAIAEKSVALARHSKGNYLLQEVLALDEAEVSKDICYQLKDHLEELSQDQHGSYVIEACLLSSGGEVLIEKFAGFDVNKLEMLATDRYGNYIVQTAFRMSIATEHHEALLSAIAGLPEDLKDDIYANYVLRRARYTRTKDEEC